MDWFNPFEGSEGGGGGSGTDNYNELINKPSINNVVLSGNKTEDDLGLQKKISSNNKISSDNVSDLGAQNLFTNATEKQNWNAKQDAIQNLQDIQSGAAAGATAVQTISINGVQQIKDNGNIDLPAYPTTLPASDTTNLYDPTGTSPVNGKAVAAALGTLDVESVGGVGKYISEISETNGKISAAPTTMDTSLSNSSTNNNCPTSKTVYDDQQRQDAALAEVVDMGAKNKIYNKIHNVGESVTTHGFTFTQQDDGGIKIEYASTDSQNSDYYMAGTFYGTAIQFDLSDNDYVMSLTTKTAVSSEISNKIRIRLYDRTVSPELKTHVYLNSTPMIFSPHATVVFITIDKPISNFPAEGIVVYPMICTKAEWDISQAYVPYGKTNAELTSDISALSTENTSQQAEINYAVNTGVKNLLPMTHTNGSITRYGVTCTWDSNSGTMTLDGTHSSGDNTSIFEFYDGSAENTIILPAGSYVLTGCPPAGSTSTYRAILTQITGAVDLGNGANFELLEPHYAAYRILISGNVTFNNMVFTPMIRRAEITDDTFVPYALPNPTLTPAVIKAVDEGAKNLIQNNCNSRYLHGVTATTNADGSITVSGASDYANNFLILYDLYAGDSATSSFNSHLTLKAGTNYINKGTGRSDVKIQIVEYNTSSDYSIVSEGDIDTTFTLTKSYFVARLWISKTANFSTPVTVYPMICTKAQWDISHQYEPYALPNPTLTPAVIKAVDEGAKNLLHFDQLGYSTLQGMSIVHRGVTFTLTDDTVVCSGTNDNTDNSHCRLYIGSDRVYVTDLCDGNHILSGTPSGGGAGKWSMSAYYGVSGVTYYNRLDYGEGVLLTEPSESGYNILIDISISKGQNASGLIFKPMICTAADWAVSQKFVPYASTNRELYEEKIGIEDAFGTGTQITANGTLDITQLGKFYCTNAATAVTVTNAPWIDAGFFGYTERSIVTADRYIQIAFRNDDSFRIAKRRYIGSWQPWSYIDTYDEGNLIPDNANLNDYTQGGKYYGGNSAGNSVSNLPVENASFNFSLEVKNASPVHTLQYLTILRTTDDPYIYKRRYYNGAWGSWYKFEGTEVTS